MDVQITASGGDGDDTYLIDDAGDVIVDGILTWDGGIYLLIFAFFALIIVNLLLKAWVDKRGGSAE